jgi:hypothetical protein
MFVGVLALVLLVCMWFVGDQEFRTKLILTIIYLALWGLIFAGESGGWFMLAGMSLWCIVVGYSTFGKHFRKG